MEGLSWIPTAAVKETEKVKKDNSITTTLNLHFISEKDDNFGRSNLYFSCTNPEALNVLKEHMDNNGQEVSKYNLPFWFVPDENKLLLKVAKRNCKLSEEELKADLINAKASFKLYVGKKLSGYSIHF